MKFIISTSLLTFLFVLNSYSQKRGQALLDSLTEQLSKMNEDSSKVQLLNDLSFNYSSIDPNKGVQYGEEAITLAEKSGWKKGKAQSFNNLGVNYSRLGDFTKALEFFNKAIPEFESTKNKEGVAKAYGNIGNVYSITSDYPKAIEYNLKALRMNEELGNKLGIAKATGNIGLVYFNQNNFSKALEYHLKAMQLNKELGNRRSIGKNAANAGSAYAGLGEYSKALEQFNNALAIAEEFNDKYDIATCIQMIGISYARQKNYQKALEYFQKGIDINEKIGNKNTVSAISGEMGRTYLKMYQDSTLKTLDKKLWLEKAKSILENTVLKNKNMYTPDDYRIMSYSAYEVYSLTGEYEKALEAFKDYSKFRDSVFNEEKTKEITSLELNYEFKKKEDSIKTINDKKELELQKQIELTALRYEYDKKQAQAKTEKERQQLQFEEELKRQQIESDYKQLNAIAEAERNKKSALAKAEQDKITAKQQAEIAREKFIKKVVLIFGSVLFIAAFIVFIFYKKRRDSKQKQKEAEFKTEVSETEMKALRSQMNPHFIFNSLNSIGDYISKNNVQEADRYLSKFAKLMRMILENSEQKDVPIADDLKALELYMQLESLRMKNKFSYEIKVDDDIDTEATLIPPLILQPFVENSIWHGLAQKEGDGKISIHIKRENNNMINCMVEDNGIGRKKSAAIKTTAPKMEKTSLGMKITQARIDILNKIKNSNAAVKLSDLEQGVRVEVMLPLATSF